MSLRLFSPAAFLSLLLSSGCSHVISQAARDSITPGVTLAAVKADPTPYLGQRLLLGGIILVNQPGTEVSTLEILAMRLDRSGEPVAVDEEAGRFLATSDRFLDPALYQSGRMVTLTASVSGRETRPMGGLTYDYPLLHITELYLWRSPLLYETTPYLPLYYQYLGPPWYLRDNPYDPAYNTYPYTPYWGRPVLR